MEMGYTDLYIKRADLQFIREFLMHGTSCLKLDEGSFEERLESARKKLKDQLQATCPENHEEIVEMMNCFSMTVEEVFMEIGIKIGIRLMQQIL